VKNHRHLPQQLSVPGFIAVLKGGLSLVNCARDEKYRSSTTLWEAAKKDKSMSVKSWQNTGEKGGAVGDERKTRNILLFIKDGGHVLWKTARVGNEVQEEPTKKGIDDDPP